MAKFRIPKARSAKPNSPEELFRTLKRGSKVPHLWVHQGDLLRAYMAGVGKPNIALELPTGGGKSLVGLLIAEYRRQAHDERVAYICPTRQLARQVHAQAEEYGIPTVVLTGKQRDYPPADFNAYNTAGKIALTTYKGVFNTNPRIDNAQCIVMDDAHAAEGYLADLWSVRIDRELHRTTYDALLDLFEDTLPESLVFHMREDASPDDAGGVGIIHPPAQRLRSTAIREILGAVSDDLIDYPWSMIAQHLDACHIYLGHSEILIRPLCPPSETHEAFSKAKQRIFMSATLGNGGDLERATGVRDIHRLPLPTGWERRGTGRRLILLPGLSLQREEADDLLRDIAQRPGRLLVLTTSTARMRKLESSWLRGSGKDVLHAPDIEADIRSFTSSANAALVLTNRYDGLDLPDDACRQMVIDDLPDATNLQERFLTQKLGAVAFLRERVRTRVMQAMGRCTRNDTDHALILVLGERLVTFLTQSEVRQSLHPELQVELGFGIDNSAELSASGFIELTEQFQTEAWEEAEQYLLEARENAAVSEDPVAKVLREVVRHELDYVYAAWSGDWTYAAGAARKVCDGLGGGRELKPYQALWYYVASNATTAAEEHRKVPPSGVADDLLNRAVACAPSLSVFLRPVRSSTSPTEHEEAVTSTATLESARLLAELGHVGTQFGRRVRQVKDEVGSDTATRFERGLDALGELLGFTVERGVGAQKAAPDSVWHLGHEVFIAWEAESEGKPESSVAVSKVRQARGHVDWVQDKYKLQNADNVHVILATPKTTLDAETRKFCGGVLHITVEGVRRLAKEATKALESVRRDAGGRSETVVAEAILREFKTAKVLPRQILGRATPLKDLP